MRSARRALTQHQQKLAQKNIAFQLHKLIRKLPVSSRACIGTYIPCDGEISPERFFLRTQYKVRLPMIQSNKKLKFGVAASKRFLKKNKYGIPEPRVSTPGGLAALQVLFVPLVAATPLCDRLGMGGGFFDRTLSQSKPWLPRPILVGLAHEIQICSALPLEHWDYPLDYVVTDTRIFSRSHPQLLYDTRRSCSPTYSASPPHRHSP